MDFKVYKDYYLKNNIKYDRVTSVLDYFAEPTLCNWFIKEGKNARKKSKIAKQIGTRVHNLITQFDKTARFNLTDNDSVSVKNCIEAYKRWIMEQKPVIKGMEITYFNNGIRVAGTADIIMKDTVIDIKTSERIKPTYWIQVAMYAWLSKLPIEYIGILKLDKLTSDYAYVIRKYDKKLVNLFMGLLNYYRFCTETKKKKGDKNGDNATYEEINSKSEIFRPEIRDDWGQWYREI